LDAVISAGAGAGSSARVDVTITASWRCIVLSGDSLPGPQWSSEGIRSMRGEDVLDRAGHIIDRRHAVDPRDDPARLVQRENRRGFGTVLGHAGADGLFVVVLAPLEFGATALVANARRGGLLELVVIARTAC